MPCRLTPGHRLCPPRSAKTKPPRAGRSVALTPEGRAFAERIRNALQEIAQASDALGSRKRDLRLFRIAVPSRESYWFVSPKELAHSPKVKAFRDWVKAELRSA